MEIDKTILRVIYEIFNSEGTEKCKISYEDSEGYTKEIITNKNDIEKEINTIFKPLRAKDIYISIGNINMTLSLCHV